MRHQAGLQRAQELIPPQRALPDCVLRSVRQGHAKDVRVRQKSKEGTPGGCASDLSDALVPDMPTASEEEVTNDGVVAVPDGAA